MDPLATSPPPRNRDEANLEANEEIKRALNPQQILEPKTPYLSPMETDDELELGGWVVNSAAESWEGGGVGSPCTHQAHELAWSCSYRGP